MEEEVSPAPEVAGSPPSVLVLEHVSIPTNNNDTTKESECSNCDHDINGATADHEVSPTHPASAPVLSPCEETTTVLMPRSRSLNSALGVPASVSECLVMTSDPGPVSRIANLSLCGSRLLQREALLFGPEEDTPAGHNTRPETDTTGTADLCSDLERLSLPATIPANICQKAMIWTEKEAVRKQVESDFHKLLI